MAKKVAAKKAVAKKKAAGNVYPWLLNRFEAALAHELPDPEKAKAFRKAVKAAPPADFNAAVQVAVEHGFKGTKENILDFVNRTVAAGVTHNKAAA